MNCVDNGDVTTDQMERSVKEEEVQGRREKRTKRRTRGKRRTRDLRGEDRGEGVTWELRLLGL